VLSKKFKETLKLADTPQYKIAIQAGVNPTLLSKWVIGAEKSRIGDKRIIKIGKILGLKESEIFEKEKVVLKKKQKKLL